MIFELLAREFEKDGREVTGGNCPKIVSESVDRKLIRHIDSQCLKRVKLL